MPRVGFEPTILASERAKTVHTWHIVAASGDNEDDCEEVDGM
jgi:hypothetical protein